MRKEEKLSINENFGFATTHFGLCCSHPHALYVALFHLKFLATTRSDRRTWKHCWQARAHLQYLDCTGITLPDTCGYWKAISVINYDVYRVDVSSIDYMCNRHSMLTRERNWLNFTQESSTRQTIYRMWRANIFKILQNQQEFIIREIADNKLIIFRTS